MVYYNYWNSIWKAVFQDGKTLFHAIWCECDRIKEKIKKNLFNWINRKLEDTRMKIVIINGSARKGNTLTAINAFIKGESNVRRDDCESGTDRTGYRIICQSGTCTWCAAYRR